MKSYDNSIDLHLILVMNVKTVSVSFVAVAKT